MNILLLIGGALSAAGVLLLQQGWRNGRNGHAQRRRWYVGGAWLLVLLAFWPWALAGGTDRGIALGVIVFMLAGAALVTQAGRVHVARNRKNGAREPRGNGEPVETLSGWRLSLRRAFVFLLAGPVAAIAALLLAANIFAWWDTVEGSAANRLAAALLIVPFAWVVLAVWATYDKPLRQRSLWMFAFLLAGTAGLYFPEFA